MPWPGKNTRATNYTEEPVVIVSKEDTCQIWAGALIMFSGTYLSGQNIGVGGQASGYNFLSGESDISAINYSGWGLIRVPELSEVHAAIIKPKSTCIEAAPNWTAGQCSGYYQSGIGGISGNMIQVKYCDLCTHPTLFSGNRSAGICWLSGTSLNSGVVDVFAFGSKY